MEPPVSRASGPSRREALHVGLAAVAWLAAGPTVFGTSRADAAPQKFSFDRLTDEMRAQAGEPYSRPAEVTGPLADLDYDDYRLLRFRPDRRRPIGPAFELAAFAPGWLFRAPVSLARVEGDSAEPITITADDFEKLNDLASRLPDLGDLPGVAGFRLHYPLNRPDTADELVAFLGASYFRALGRDSVYGLSARGLALNTAARSAEEFPRFSRFYLEPGEGQVTVFAALESPSVTGAYRFVIRPGATTTMDVTCRLFFRAAVEQLGIAPLTSMFLFDATNRARFDDFRSGVHDSDGLRIVRSDGDVLWRPLNNPPRLAGSYFPETAPVRIGLHQRDRRFDRYDDAEARYHRRPSLDVEPLGDWGRGHVRLVEIPTDREVHDNIVAFWVPEAPVAAGEAREYAYRLHWGDLPPDPAGDLAFVDETRAGHGGVAGGAAPEGVRKFVVEFAGGIPGRLGAEARIEAVTAASGGAIVEQTLKWVPEAQVWRLAMDVAGEAGAIVELRAHLAGYGRKVSEIWLQQWVVPT